MARIRGALAALATAFAPVAIAGPSDADALVGGARPCVDAANHRAVCHMPPNAPDTYENWVHGGCTAPDQYGACSGDPQCFQDSGRRVPCAYPIAWAAAVCADGHVTRANPPDDACKPHGGVQERW